MFQIYTNQIENLDWLIYSVYWRRDEIILRRNNQQEMIKDTTNSEHYHWGDACDGWHLVQTDSLSIIQEKIPPGASENLHYHSHAQQFFYILKGIAVFEVDDKIYEVREGQGFHILPKKKQRIFNRTNQALEFIVTSEPKSRGDRIDL